MLVAADNLYSGGKTVPDFLLTNDIHLLVESDDKTMIDRLHCYASELLLLALSDSPKSGIALRLLSCVNIENPILLSCMHDATFVRCMSGVSSSNLSDTMVAKMAQLTQVAFEASIKDAIVSCWYLNSFMQYLDNPYVYDLFESILKHTGRELHDWIASYRLVNDIKRAIENADCKEKANFYESKSLQKLYNCFRLIQIGLANESLVDLFKTHDMLATLTLSLPGTTHANIDGARFRAIREFCSNEFIICIGNYIQSAIRIIEKYPNGPAPDIVEAYRLVSKAIDNSELISKALLRSSVYEMTLAVLTRYYNISILISAIRVFLTHSISNEILCPKVIRFYKDFIMNECRVRTYGQLAATCWYIMTFIFHEQQMNEKVKKEVNKYSDLVAFIKTDLKTYRKKLTHEYGGEIPTTAIGKLHN